MQLSDGLGALGNSQASREQGTPASGACYRGEEGRGRIEVQSQPATDIGTPSRFAMDEVKESGSADLAARTQVFVRAGLYVRGASEARATEAGKKTREVASDERGADGSEWGWDWARTSFVS